MDFEAPPQEIDCTHLNLIHHTILGFSVPQGCEKLVLKTLNANDFDPLRRVYVYGPNYMHQVHPAQNLHHQTEGFSFPQHCEQQVLSNSNPPNLDELFGTEETTFQWQRVEVALARWR
ncbi:hypothetical protein VNO78_25821 [Psophocarpus tetragonolobus]|uniref:Uncharacterized protein n=1 Tax=Psophocarpus tetragonolobus TaxID=3891 RepID=A0AAN9SAV1_PSOTE